jgi:hypothetical protein
MAMAGMALVRSKDLGEPLPNFILSSKGVINSTGFQNETEYTILLPKSPLVEKTNTSAKGPFHELDFGAETYLTQSKRLAVRLKIWGSDVGGIKQKTNYFEGMDYISQTPAYPTNTHSRRYNGTFVKGNVSERQIILTQKNSSRVRQISSEITAYENLTEIMLTRPMSATVNFTYSNISWSPQNYLFDVQHYKRSQSSSYSINTTPKDIEYNESDAAKSIMLGLFLSSRGSPMGSLRELIENRLEELLKGYEFKLEFKDTCGEIFDINGDSEPIGRTGVAIYYVAGERSLAQLKLTVWR